MNKSFLVLFFKKERKEALLFEKRSKNIPDYASSTARSPGKNLATLGSKKFFFAKKNQKTFANGCTGVRSGRLSCVARQIIEASRLYNQKFLASFLQKRSASFLGWR